VGGTGTLVPPKLRLRLLYYCRVASEFFCLRLVCSAQSLHCLHASETFFNRYMSLSLSGLVPTIERRYRAQQMALWLDLIPRLHQAPNLGPTNLGPDACRHQLDDADRDSTFEPLAARVTNPECRHWKQTPTAELPVGVTSFPVVTHIWEHAERRRSTQSDVTPRYATI